MKRNAPKPSKDKIEMMGTITEALKGTQFIVELDNGHEVLAYPCGKMRKYYIRLLLGDRVKVEISPYDLTRARITYRYKRMQHRRGPNPTAAIVGGSALTIRERVSGRARGF